VRFYGFHEADFRLMTFEAFLKYLTDMPELKRIEAGKPLSADERVKRLQAKAERVEAASRRLQDDDETTD
jgi:hypothetical protein